jgi:hypothetical protein
LSRQFGFDALRLIGYLRFGFPNLLFGFGARPRYRFGLFRQPLLPQRLVLFEEFLAGKLQRVLKLTGFSLRFRERALGNFTNTLSLPLAFVEHLRQGPKKHILQIDGQNDKENYRGYRVQQ